MIEDAANRTSWEVTFPESAEPQDERFILVRDGHHEEIRLHDYATVYRIPGLYEHVVHDLLRCQSPTVAVQGLTAAVQDLGRDVTELRVLDLGAGVGIVGELLRNAGVPAVVGLDNIVEARDACARDRPGTYEDYVVADLEHPEPAVLERLTGGQFEVLMCVGALGGGHVPPNAFAQALNVLTGEALVVITLHERWLEAGSPDPFSAALHDMTADGYLDVLTSTPFLHRLDMAGAPVTFRLIVARRVRHLPVTG